MAQALDRRHAGANEGELLALATMTEPTKMEHMLRVAELGFKPWDFTRLTMLAMGRLRKANEEKKT